MSIRSTLPKTIFGLKASTFILRLAYAIGAGALTIIVFYFIPNLLFRNFGEFSSYFSNSQDYFFYYAILLAFLGGLQIIFKGSHLGDGAAIFNGVSQIFYIYLLTNGGIFVVNLASSGLSASIDFRTILYLMMVPSALMVVSSVVNASSRGSLKRTLEFEEIELR